MHSDRPTAFAAQNQLRQQLQRAEQALRARQFDAAEAICNSVLAANPRQLVALQLLGLAQAQRDDRDAAERTFKRILAINPRAAAVHANLGNLYMMKGDATEAERCYRTAISLSPSQIEAHFNLGLVLNTQGQHVEALSALKKAIDLKPDYVDALTQSGVILLSLDNLQAAIEMFKRSLAIRDNQFEAHYNLGLAYFRLDQFENAKLSLARAGALNDQRYEVFLVLGKALHRLQNRTLATQALARAALLKPDNADVHGELAVVFLEDGWTKAAIDEIGKALALQPDRVEFHITHARILADLNRLEDAEAANLRAVALAPESLEALGALGRAHMGVGRLDEARTMFERARALHPDSIQPLLDLARVQKFREGDERLPALESFLATEDWLPPLERTALHFALGRAYDDIKQYDRAFAHFDTANRLQRESLPDTEAQDVLWFEQTKAIFTKDFIAARAGAGFPSALPVFILGMPRSGTTLVEQIVSSHPLVRAAGEVQDLNAATQILITKRKYTKPVPAVLGDFTPADLRELGETYVGRLRMRAPEGERVTDKLLGNYNRLGLIKLALPNATVIHCRRNPVDSCLSIYSNHFADVQEHSNDLGRLGRFYRRYYGLMEHWRQVLPQGSFLDLQYEETVHDIEGTARRIIAHCGLEWDPRCLDFQRNERRVATLSITQVRQPVYTSSIDRWRNYETHLGPLLEGLGDLAPA
ncbi:MAG TPA: sulfotransferase [Rhizomicrobium sp.]